ncbi:MAG TPA: TonB-dependent receptor, partial [Polyangiaceae bacterium]|nr:TonB-dependent receptor [Polyangiaceae bacterium]
AEARVATNHGALGNARVAGRPLRWLGLALSGGHQYTDAYRSDPSSAQTTGSARQLDTAGAAITFGTDAKRRLRLNVDYSQNRLDGTDLAVGGAIFDRTQLQEQFATSALFTQKSGRLYWNASAQYTQFREQYLNDQRQATALDSYEDNHEHQGLVTNTASYQWNERQRTTVGAELMAQLLDSARLSSTGYRARYSAFAEHRWTIAKTAAKAATGTATGISTGTTARDLLSVVPGARLDLDSQFGNQLSPKLALRWDPLPQLAVRASYGRGFRAPSFQELLLRFENPAVGYVVLGNPDLTAESSHSVDVSAEWRPNPQWFFSLAAFRNDLSNMISTITAPNPGVVGTLFTYANIDRAWTMGSEALGIWSPHELLTLTLGYTLMGTRDEAQDRPLPGRPVHRFTFRTLSTHSATGLSLMARGSLALDRTYFVDDATGTQAVTPEPFFQLDVRLAKTFTRHFELFVGATNLADAGDTYAAVLPRQFYAGLGGHY